MCGILARATALFAVFLAATALASIDVEIRNGDRVTGTLSPGTEVEVVRFRVPQDALITLKGAAVKKGVPQVHLDLKTPGGGAPVASAEGKTATISKWKATESGVWSVEISSKDHATTGDYSLSVAWKSATSYGGKRAVVGGALDLNFSADADATATFAVKKVKKSAAAPELSLLTYVPELSVDHLFGASAKRKLGRTGDCVLHVTSPADGDATATVKIKPPKASNRKYALTEKALGVGDAAFAALVGPAGGLVEFPSGGAGAGAQLDGSSVLVPSGALPVGTAIVISTAPDIPPTGGGVGVGATVAFGPDGLRFDASDKTKVATITIPFDPSFAAQKDQITIYTRDAKGAVKPVPRPYDFAADFKTVSFASSHFSSYQAQGPIPTGGNFISIGTITESRDICSAVDLNSTQSGPLAVFIAEGAARTVGAIRVSVSAPGFVRETWVGGGTQTQLPASRLQFQFPGDVTAVFQDASQILYCATATQIFVVDPTSGQVTLAAGTGAVGDSGDQGPPLQANFTNIRRLLADDNGGLFIIDVGAHRIRFMTAAQIVAWAGNGTQGIGADGGSVATTAFVGPSAMSLAPTGGLYVADGARIRWLDPNALSAPVNATIAGSSTGATGSTGDGGQPAAALFQHVEAIGMYFDPSDSGHDELMVVDDVDQTVRQLDFTGGTVTLIAGSHGTPGYSGDRGNLPGLLNGPNGIVADPGLLYVSDKGNQKIRALLLTQ